MHTQADRKIQIFKFFYTSSEFLIFSFSLSRMGSCYTCVSPHMYITGYLVDMEGITQEQILHISLDGSVITQLVLLSPLQLNNREDSSRVTYHCPLPTRPIPLFFLLFNFLLSIYPFSGSELVFLKEEEKRVQSHLSYSIAAE